MGHLARGFPLLLQTLLYASLGQSFSKQLHTLTELRLYNNNVILWMYKVAFKCTKIPQ